MESTRPAQVVIRPMGVNAVLALHVNIAYDAERTIYER